MFFPLVVLVSLDQLKILISAARRLFDTLSNILVEPFDGLSSARTAQPPRARYLRRVVEVRGDLEGLVLVLDGRCSRCLCVFVAFVAVSVLKVPHPTPRTDLSTIRAYPNQLWRKFSHMSGHILHGLGGCKVE